MTAVFPALRRQIMWSRLLGVVEEQARTLMKIAFSPTVREAGDLSAGLFDARGRMVAQAVTGTPGHVNSLAAAAKHFLAAYPLEALEAGDHLITNDPWMASGHLHDITVFSPIFREGRPVAFFGCTCHQVDIGGLGMGPDGRSIFEEGLYLPILPIMRAGHLNRDVMAIIRGNVRIPDAVEGDVLAYITANEVSGRRLLGLLDEFGLADIEDLADEIIAISEAGMRAAIAALPDGTYRNHMRLDGYETAVDLHAALTIAGERITVDFAGSAAASRYGINLVLNYTRAYASYGVRAAIAPEIPNNEGSLAPIGVEAPVGSILNVERPAPVSARHIIGQFLPELVLGCLAEVMPELVPAEGAACNWGAQLRGRVKGQPFEILFFNAGGAGARPSRDGLSATAFPSGIRSIPVEICETVAPIIIHRKELRPGSGGDGQFRGGLGQCVEVSTIDGSPFQLFAVFDRVAHPARGRAGGLDGAPGRVSTLSGVELSPKGLQPIAAGDGVRLELPGGAGFGPPAARETTLRREDEVQGYG